MKTLIFLCFFISCLFNSCISVDLSSLKDQTAREVVFQPPPPPYKKVSKKGMDLYWEHPAEGASLSFFSNCSDSAPFTPLARFQKELLAELKTFRVTGVEQTQHQNQKAVRLQLKQLRPKILNMDLFLFRKEKCFYALNFLMPAGSSSRARPHIQPRAPSPSAQRPREVFSNFIREFRAP